MRITEVQIPKTFQSNTGLEDIRMKRLGEVVVLAGPNAAGKTRLLKRIKEVLQGKPTESQWLEARSNRGSAWQALISAREELGEIKRKLSQDGTGVSTTTSFESLAKQKEQKQATITRLEGRIRESIPPLNWWHELAAPRAAWALSRRYSSCISSRCLSFCS